MMDGRILTKNWLLENGVDYGQSLLRIVRKSCLHCRGKARLML